MLVGPGSANSCLLSKALLLRRCPTATSNVDVPLTPLPCSQSEPDRVQIETSGLGRRIRPAQLTRHHRTLLRLCSRETCINVDRKQNATVSSNFLISTPHKPVLTPTETPSCFLSGLSQSSPLYFFHKI